MPGLTMRVEADDREVRQALDHLAAAGADLSPAMDAIGAALVASTLDRFERGVGPDGAAWPVSIRARKQGGQTLVDRGRLRDSITYVFGPDSVEVGTNVIYAAVHQLGATIEARNAPFLHFVIGGRHAAVRRVTIPPRPFLGIDAGDEAEISAILGDHVLPPGAR